MLVDCMTDHKILISRSSGASELPDDEILADMCGRIRAERGRPARPLRFDLVRVLGAERNTQGYCREAQRCCRRCTCQPRIAQATESASRANSAARAIDSPGAGRRSKGRNRKVLADHQGSKHKCGMAGPSTVPDVGQAPSCDVTCRGVYPCLPAFGRQMLYCA